LIIAVAVLAVGLFTSREAFAGNPCLEGDVNCDSLLTSADIIVLVNYVFRGGPPSMQCGVSAVILRPHIAAAYRRRSYPRPLGYAGN
jgi:hypothetical protein